MRTVLRDALSRLGAYVVLLAVAVVFLGGAVAGLSMIDRLGSLGLAMYAVAIVSWGLLFVPLVAYALGLRQRSSRRHREDLQARQAVERLRYGLRDTDDPG